MSQLSLLFIEFNSNNYKFPLKRGKNSPQIFNFLFRLGIFFKALHFLFVASDPKIASRENDIEQITFRDLLFRNQYSAFARPHTVPSIQKNQIFCLHCTNFIFHRATTLHIHFPHSIFFGEESEILFVGNLWQLGVLFCTSHAYGELFFVELLLFNFQHLGKVTKQIINNFVSMRKYFVNYESYMNQLGQSQSNCTILFFIKIFKTLRIKPQVE